MINLNDLSYLLDAVKSVDRTITEINKLPLPAEHKKMLISRMDYERKEIVAQFSARHQVEVEV